MIWTAINSLLIIFILIRMRSNGKKIKIKSDILKNSEK